MGKGTRDRCAKIMRRQHGVITREQALSAGLSRRQIDLRLRSGVWQRLLPTVYRPAELPATWHQRVMAACLWAGAGAAASHRTATALLRLPGFGRGSIEITTSRRLERSGLVVHRRTLRPNDVIRVDGINVTCVPMTLVDLGSIESLDRLETAVDDILVRGLVTTDRLQAAMDGNLKGTPGATAMRRVLEAYTHAPLESPLERRFLRLLRSAGLPEPEIQYPIRDGARLLARVDFAYPELRLAIEVDGYSWHGGRKGWAHDVCRRNELSNRRWSILHITKEHMDGTGARAVSLLKEARSTRAEPS
ncbi:MAG: type IV toxin-antitoxin system AbiEi family antitoxin domain-containing protein [Actinomycetota bacterium]